MIGILPVLMLSYNDLPVHLKHFSVYCSIYPKDYRFYKDQVIHLWIANGIVQKIHSGNQSFHELISKSLFDMVPTSCEGDVEKFLMHDLVIDLTQLHLQNFVLGYKRMKDLKCWNKVDIFPIPWEHMMNLRN